MRQKVGGLTHRSGKEKRIAAADVPLEQVRRLALLEDAGLDALVRKHWGNLKPGTPEEKDASRSPPGPPSPRDRPGEPVQA